MLRLIRTIRDVWKLRKPPPAVASGAVYSPAVFDAGDPAHAMAIAVSPVPGMTVEQRWEMETRNLVAELRRTTGLDRNSRVIDYGCGMGRLAKALIEATGCSVVGVDISAGMRTLARQYVNSERFTACDPRALDGLMMAGYRATHACACWVLQHCRSPADEISLLEFALVPGGRLFVLNSRKRWLPTDKGWMDDGISVELLLQERFGAGVAADVSSLVVSPVLAAQSFAVLLRKAG